MHTHNMSGNIAYFHRPLYEKIFLVAQRSVLLSGILVKKSVYFAT